MSKVKTKKATDIFELKITERQREIVYHLALFKSRELKEKFFKEELDDETILRNRKLIKQLDAISEATYGYCFEIEE